MWWWTKVRKAKISDEVRNRFELLGAEVVAMRLASLSAEHIPDPIFKNIEFQMGEKPKAAAVAENQQDALDWLQEQRDKAHRREDRLETAEIAILVFVGAELLIDLLKIAHLIS